MNNRYYEGIKKEMELNKLYNAVVDAITSAPEEIKAAPVHYKKVQDFIKQITIDGCGIRTGLYKKTLTIDVTFSGFNRCTTFVIKTPLKDYNPKRYEIMNDQEIETEVNRFEAERDRIQKELDALRKSTKSDFLKEQLSMYL